MGHIIIQDGMRSRKHLGEASSALFPCLPPISVKTSSSAGFGGGVKKVPGMPVDLLGVQNGRESSSPVPQVGHEWWRLWSNSHCGASPSYQVTKLLCYCPSLCSMTPPYHVLCL